MWTCPNCHPRFFNRNQSHSCGKYSVDDFLNGRTPLATALFYAFLERFSEIGPYEVHPVKTRVALLTKMRFASVNRLGKNFLSGHLVLTAPESGAPAFFRIENVGNRFFIHHFRLHSRDEAALLLPFMRMAYDVGLRKHVARETKE